MPATRVIDAHRKVRIGWARTRLTVTTPIGKQPDKAYAVVIKASGGNTLKINDQLALYSLREAVTEALSDDVWTVIGIWQGSEPVAAGALRGRHAIDGGDMNGDGCWATYVGADDAQSATVTAVEEMRATVEADI